MNKNLFNSTLQDGDSTSPFPEFETEGEVDRGQDESSGVYTPIDDKPNCRVDIIFKSGERLQFEHWAPPSVLLELWGKPGRGFVILDIDTDYYITIDKKEVASKVVIPL